MCGIVGAIAGRDVVPMLVDGLKRLEYRGYDSAGIALREEAGPRTREVAGMLADRAIHDDPFGLLRMGLITFRDYFDTAKRVERMRSDLGISELPNEKTMQLLRDRFHYDYASVAELDTPIFDYFEHASWWLIACLFLLAPLAVAMLLLERRHQPGPSLLLALLALGLVIGQLLCSHIVSFRYVHPLPVLFLLFLAAVIDRWLASRMLAGPSSEAPAGNALRPVESGSARSTQE